MKHLTTNVNVSLALGLGLVGAMALLWLLAGGLPVTQAQGPDGYSVYYVATNCSGVTHSPCYESLQEAVDAADAPDDAIKVAAGTYSGVHAREGVTQVLYVDKTVAIHGGYTTAFIEPPVPGVNLTTLDAQGEGRALYVYDDFAGDNHPTITGLRITGGDAGGMDNGGGVYVTNAAVTLSDNHVFGNVAKYGGGLYLRRSDATLEGNTVTTNTVATHGGGLYLDTSSGATLQDNTIVSNSAASYGGGLYLISSDATFNGNTINDNAADRGGGLYLTSSGVAFNGNVVNDNHTQGGGGGMYLSSSDATLGTNTIHNNNASASGGGLYLYKSDATLDENQVTWNTASTWGGGLYLYESDPTLKSNDVISNVTAGSGGGLYVESNSVPLLHNNVVADNQAGSRGSGLYVKESFATLLHTTLARNGGGYGEGIYVTQGIFNQGTVALTNTIVVSHAVGINVTSGNTATLEATLWGAGVWANGDDWSGSGDITTDEDYWGDPVFSNPPVGDYHIGPTSAAREAGVDAGVTEDMDNDLRPSDWAFDIGADELGSALVIRKSAWPLYLHDDEVVTYTLTITSAGSEAATSVHLTDTLPPPQLVQNIVSDPPLPCTPSTDWGGSSYCDLGTLASRETVRITLTARMTTALPDETSWRMRNTAWVKASETPSRTAVASTIRVYCRARLDRDPTEYETVQAAVDAALTDDEVWVSGYCAYVVPREDITQTVYLSKTLVVRGGYNLAFDTRDVDVYPTTLDARGWGRVFYVSGNITPTVEGLRIVNGDAAGLGGGIIPTQDAGGGVYVIDATPTLSDVWVLSSTARYGGGLYLERSTATLENSTVQGNTASDNGGGLYLYYSNATLNGNTINYNDAPYGGGLHLRVSDAMLRNNTINDNTAAQYGAGLYLNGSDPTLNGSVVNGNTANYNGGGLYLTGSDPTLDGNTVNDNAAQFGGGLYMISSDPMLRNSDVNANIASRYGGGLYMVNSNATLHKNFIQGNEAQNGGGLYLSGSDWAAFNANWISDNSASGSGGGMYLNKSDVKLTNNVVADNQASSWGDGLYIATSAPRLLHTTIARNGETGLDVRYDSSVELVNTILVGHEVGVQVASGNTVNLEATLWGSGSWINDDDWDGAGTVNHTLDYWDDPGFADGDAGDYHIIQTSATIDAGVDAGVLTDVDGEPRPAGFGFELGADERGLSMLLKKDVWPRYLGAGDTLTYTLVVTATGSETNPATSIQLADTLPSLQQATGALSSWGSCSYHTAWGSVISCSLNDMLVGQSARVTLTARLTDTIPNPQIWRMRNAAWIVSNETTTRTAQAESVWVYCRAQINDGPTPYNAVQDAVDAAQAGDVVKVAGYCAPTDAGNQVVYLDESLTIQGGWHVSFTQRNVISFPTTLDGREQRRVLHVSGAVNPTLQGLRIVGGDATGLGGGPAGEDAGGGLYVVNAAANLWGNQVLDNRAEVGGGLYLSGSDATLTNNVIAGNQASGAGSGLYVAGASPRLLHTTLADNSGDESGVYVTHDGSTYSFPAFTNTIFANHVLGITVTQGSGIRLESTLWHDNAVDWGGEDVDDSQNYYGDPTFADPGRGDYHVGLASAARDIGLDVGLVSDLDEQPRPLGEGHEIGADESGLFVTKRADPDPVWSGAQLTYLISITNMSPTPLVAAITDVLPAQVSTAQTHVWSPVDMEPGETWKEVFTGTVQEDYAGTLTNIIQVSTDQGVGGVYTHTSLSLAALLSATKQADRAVVYGGETLTYTLRVVNTGNVDLQATISDTLPPHVTTTQPLVWSPVNLPPSASWEQALAVSVDFDYQGTLTNVLRVTTDQGVTGVSTETTTAFIPPPAIPTLLSPPNGYVTVTQAITLAWQQSVGATADGYNLRLDGGAVITPSGTTWPVVLSFAVHTWQVRAYNDSGYSDWSDTWTVEIVEVLPPPGVPTLLSPADDALVAGPVITLTWEAGAGAPASGYRLRLGDTVTDVNGTTWSTSLPTGVYTWTAQAYNAYGDSDWAVPWTFEVVDRPGVPVLLAPSDGLITTTQAIVLSWQQGAGPDPTGYELDLDGGIVITTATTWPTNLDLGLHTWRVRAYDDVSASDWSDEWTVEVTDTLPPPEPPTLLSPPDGAVVATRDAVLTWQANQGAAPTSYDLELDGETHTPNQATWSAHLDLGDHTWRVCARNSAGCSAWTASWTFTVVNNAPYTPDDPNPADGAGSVTLNQVLSWQGGDPDGDPVTYTVALGSGSPPPEVSSGVTITNYDPGGLDPEVTYYWRITASDGMSTSVGAIWSFSTAESGGQFVYLPLVLKQ
jgi:uncharacterized repeat protein (TIGR01451 family)